MTVEPEPPLAAAALEDGAPAGELPPAAPVLLLPVLHAATSSATPKALPAPAASRARADIRFAMKFRIAFVSPLSAARQRQVASSSNCYYSYVVELPAGLDAARRGRVIQATPPRGRRTEAWTRRLAAA